MIAINPRQLEVFAAIATGGSVRAAGERLGLTQPAASMALAELERLLGRPLFDRCQRRLVLNENGRALLPAAREIVERLRDLVADRSTVDPTESLAVGASNTVGNYLVGDLLGGFVAARPRARVSLRVANSEEILAGVLDCSLDVGCVEADLQHPEIDRLPWRGDELCICASTGHALAARRRLSVADLARQRWLLREAGSGTRRLLERALPAPLDVVLELGQSEAIKQAVIAGLGIAALPRAAIADAVTAGRVVVLPTPFLDLRRSLWLLLRRGRWRGTLLRTFVDTLTAPH